MKKILIGLVLLTLASCGQYERTVAKVTGYSEVCVSGVVYLQFPSGATVKYQSDGNIARCK